MASLMEILRFVSPMWVHPAGPARDKRKIGSLGAQIKSSSLDSDLYEMYISYMTYNGQRESIGSLSVSEARAEFADTLRRVADRGERVRLSRSGRDVAAMVPIADLELLEALEDRADLEAVREALKSSRRISYSDLRKKLGL